MLLVICYLLLGVVVNLKIAEPTRVSQTLIAPK